MYVVYNEEPEPTDKALFTRSAEEAHRECERRIRRVRDLYGPAYARYFEDMVLRCTSLSYYVMVHIGTYFVVLATMLLLVLCFVFC